MKKTLFILPLFVFQAWLLSSCSQAETYAEQKDKEYKAINSFLGRDIVVRDRVVTTMDVPALVGESEEAWRRLCLR